MSKQRIATWVKMPFAVISIITLLSACGGGEQADNTTQLSADANEPITTEPAERRTSELQLSPDLTINQDYNLPLSVQGAVSGTLWVLAVMADGQVDRHQPLATIGLVSGSEPFVTEVRLAGHITMVQLELWQANLTEAPKIQQFSSLQGAIEWTPMGL
ncbi:MAG: hypothetical protein R3Y10_09670 [Ferrimonas sp.]